MTSLPEATTGLVVVVVDDVVGGSGRVVLDERCRSRVEVVLTSSLVVVSAEQLVEPSEEPEP